MSPFMWGLVLGLLTGGSFPLIVFTIYHMAKVNPSMIERQTPGKNNGYNFRV